MKSDVKDWLTPPSAHKKNIETNWKCVCVSSGNEKYKKMNENVRNDSERIDNRI